VLATVSTAAVAIILAGATVFALATGYMRVPMLFR
jgi:hypothetical protein